MEFHLSGNLCILVGSMPLPNKIAIVHDWLVSMRGGERVLEVLCKLFPDAHLFTLVHREQSLSLPIERMHTTTSFLQRLPFGVSHYQYYLPVFPLAAQSLDVSGYDLVISSSSAVAKGVKTRTGGLHICYCHTPMRYVWDQYDQYFGKGRSSPAVRLAMRLVRNYLRRWDVETAQGVNYYIANSRYVQERIRRIYRREAEVLYPPVDVKRFSVSRNDEGYFLIVSALVPYKRIDLAVHAFNSLGSRLVIVGSGSEEKKLKAMAKCNIEFHETADDDAVKKFYENCRAVVFPGEEDFGIVPVEAMACGKPVIAFGRGGVTETVVDKTTGIFFREQTPSDLIDAIHRCEQLSFDGNQIRAHAEQFATEIFTAGIAASISAKWEAHQSGRNHP